MTLLRRAAALATSLPGRLLITTVLLALVAVSIDWGLLTDRLAGAAWGWFALGSALILAGFGVAAIRWHELVRAAGLQLRVRTTLRAYAVGAFANNLLPTGFGGDAVRAWMVARSRALLAPALTSVVIDRVSALSCLILLGWIGVALDSVSIPAELVGLLGAATVLLVAVAAFAAALPRVRRARRLLPQRFRPSASEIARTLRAYGQDRGLQVRVTVLGLLFQALIVIAFWCLAKALDLPLDPPLLAVVLPLILIAMVAPISIAGFGVREGAFVVLLGTVGISSSDAVLLSLLTVAAVGIASLPGGLALAVRGERPEASPLTFEAGAESSRVG